MHAINGSSQYLNAPVMVMQASAILGSLGMLVTAGIFGDAASRDVQTRMHSLFYTSPVREAHYLGGRFLGGLLVNAVLVMGVPLGLLARVGDAVHGGGEVRARAARRVRPDVRADPAAERRHHRRVHVRRRRAHSAGARDLPRRHRAVRPRHRRRGLHERTRQPRRSRRCSIHSAAARSRGRRSSGRPPSRTRGSSDGRR